MATAVIDRGRLFMPLSVGQLLEHWDLVERARDRGARILVPTGALIGLDAVDAEGAALGTVVAVHNFGASDIVEIAPESGGPTLLVAFTDANVPKVDIEGGRIVVVPPEEFGEEE